MDLNKLREITEKLNDSLLLKGHAYPVLDLFIKQQEEALILPVVGVTLPTTEEIELRLKQVVDKGFKEYEVVEKREYSLGFRACYNWLKIKQMKAGN